MTTISPETAAPAPSKFVKHLLVIDPSPDVEAEVERQIKAVHEFGPPNFSIEDIRAGRSDINWGQLGYVMQCATQMPDGQGGFLDAVKQPHLPMGPLTGDGGKIWLELVLPRGAAIYLQFFSVGNDGMANQARVVQFIAGSTPELGYAPPTSILVEAGKDVSPEEMMPAAPTPTVPLTINGKAQLDPVNPMDPQLLVGAHAVVVKDSDENIPYRADSRGVVKHVEARSGFMVIAMNPASRKAGSYIGADEDWVVLANVALAADFAFFLREELGADRHYRWADFAWPVPTPVESDFHDHSEHVIATIGPSTPAEPMIDEVVTGPTPAPSSENTAPCEGPSSTP